MHTSDSSAVPSPSADHALPANASLENLRKQAKTLLKTQRSSIPPGPMPQKFTLSQAQHATAQRYGFASWPRLVAHFKSAQPADRVRRENGRTWIDGVPALQWGRSPEPTYIGALDAAFCGSGRPLDVNTMLGDSGLAFRLRWARGVEDERWCGSSPVGEWPEERDTLGRATGYLFDWAFPDANAPKPIERIVSEIDAGRPILAYGKQHDVSVIYGYEDAGQTLVLSEYWSDGEPVVMPAAQINGVTAWHTEAADPLPRGEAVEAGLRLAVKRWNQGTEDTPYEPTTRYHHGPLAYREWIADIQRAHTLTDEQRGNLYFLNGWNYSSLHMSRRDHAAKFLRLQARHLPEAAQEHARRAVTAYEQLAAYLGKWSPTDDKFGFIKQKAASSWTEGVRAAEVDWLQGLAVLDTEAMGHVESAVLACDFGEAVG